MTKKDVGIDAAMCALERQSAMVSNQTLYLDEWAFNAFLEACEQTPPPNAALQAAQKRRENLLAGGKFAKA